LLPDSGWQEQLWVMQNIGRREALREAWHMYKASFDAPFQDFLEEQFVIGADQMARDGPIGSVYTK